jgi:hypothetical protein
MDHSFASASEPECKHLPVVFISEPSDMLLKFAVVSTLNSERCPVANRDQIPQTKQIILSLGVRIIKFHVGDRVAELFEVSPGKKFGVYAG